jgi:hypothetical protein
MAAVGGAAREAVGVEAVELRKEGIFPLSH